MKSWRLSWGLSEISHISNFKKHHRVLKNSWKYWLALVLKFFPHVWPFTFQFVLREGGTFIVKRFMTLFIYDEIFVDRCYDLPYPLPEKPVIVDVGSNTGLFILRMKQLYPESTIIGFEPLTENYVQLCQNLERSRLDGVTVFDCGIGGKMRKETLYVHPRNIGGNSIYESQAHGSKHVEIDIIDVEQMLSKTNGRKCDLLKLDCEGAEFEIIKAMTPETARRIRTILFESTPVLYEIGEVVGHLEQIGYNVGKNRGLFMAVHTTDPRE